MTALKQFDLMDDKKTLFIFGGSQGSAAINRSVSNMVDELNDFQVLWQTGNNHYEELKHHETESVRIRPFIDDMKSAYALADLTVSRAGALTIAELTACGLPSVLIPFPSAAADHQTHNAKALEEQGAAKMLPESEMDSTNLSVLINHLLNNEHTLNTMSERSKALGKPEAVSVIVDHILERVGV
ncbi:MAG TPA: hypothetical protein ENH49_03120 [Candidatus Marinimicrobia bacterium]|nr:hypothetical protein [Candidatus Neomarinimicrobiota bacterium]